jgi:hypothetical protein
MTRKVRKSYIEIQFTYNLNTTIICNSYDTHVHLSYIDKYNMFNTPL